MAVEYVDYEKLVAERQQAKTQAEKEQFELETEKKAYADRQDYSKGVADILSQSMKSQEQKEAPKEEAGPGGYDPATNTTGEDREKAVNFKNEMASNQKQLQGYQQQAKQLQALMLNAAKHYDPEMALKHRAELDGLGDKAIKSQTDALILKGKQAEFYGQQAQGYLTAPTDENWYNFLREVSTQDNEKVTTLMSVPREQRETVARAIIDTGRTIKQTTDMQLKAAGMKLKQDTLKETTRYHEGTLAARNRTMADTRSYRSASLAFQKSKQTDAEKEKHIGDVNRVVRAQQSFVNSLESENKGLESQLSKLDKSLAPEEDVAEAKAVIQRKLDTNQTELDDAKSELQGYNQDLRDATYGGDKKEETKPTETTKPTSKSMYHLAPNANTSDVALYKKLMEENKDNPEARKILNQKALKHGLIVENK